jgi:uncharacterized lipoprotein YbaY
MPVKRLVATDYQGPPQMLEGGHQAPLKSRARSRAIVCLACFIAIASLDLVKGQEIRDRQAVERAVTPTATPGQSRAWPPTVGRPPGRFKLGIMARNTTTGVELTQVLANSVAQRVGLEAGDIIVSVEGYQVGYVSGRLYDLGDELTNRVNSQDRVELLVLKLRDHRLVNVSVQFSAATWAITGTIDTPDRTAAGRATRLSVRLLDVTHAHWNDLAVAEVNLEAPRRWPIAYRLEVDPARLRAGHRYAVDARLSDRGLTLLQTRSPARVVLSEKGSLVALTLVSVGNRPDNIATPYDQITRWYERYLGRRPSERELTVWQSDLDTGRSLNDIQADILSSTEFYERQQSDRDRYVDEVYRVLKGQTPTIEQHRVLIEQLDRQGDVRNRFVREMAKP